MKLKNPQIPIGQVNYTYLDGMLMISYWLATNYQGQGYASEIILPLTKKIFECEDINNLYISCSYENLSSAKLAEKICIFINDKNKYYYSKNEGYTSGEIDNKIIKFRLFRI